MKFTLSSRRVLGMVLCIVLVGVTCVGLYQFLINPEQHALTIMSMELLHSEEEAQFIVTVDVQNTGSTDINEAELNLVFIKDNDIVDSEKQSIQLGSHLDETFTMTFPNVLFEAGSTYKAIATIYQKNMLLDTKTITKQF